MKSLCIKTNNKIIIDYLLNEFQNINIDETYITLKSFKHFSNIILHCKIDNNTLFINTISNILTKTIIYFYEKQIIKNSINLNYFYFNSLEKQEIVKNTLEILNNYDSVKLKYDLLNNTIFEHLLNHKSLYLNAFINFRLNNYLKLIEEKMDLAVNQFLINKEYLEFVNILKLYINSESVYSQTNHLHLIYKNGNSTIIDDNNNVISCNDNITKAKYISDISFSSNDLALNTLLNLLPKTITIHLIDEYCDEFINTLKLIFNDRIKICKDCNICNLYKYKQSNQK